MQFQIWDSTEGALCSLSVWSSIARLTVRGSSLLMVSHFSTSPSLPVCLKAESSVQFVDAVSSALLRLPLFLLLSLLSLLVLFRVDKIHVAHTVHKIARHCVSLWTFSLFSPPHTCIPLYFRTHREVPKFVYSVFCL